MVIFIIHLQGQLLYRCIFFIRNEELADAFLLLNYEFRKLNKLASAPLDIRTTADVLNLSFWFRLSNLFV